MASMTRNDVVTYSRERHGMSAFVLEDGFVYHTYPATREELTWSIASIDTSTLCRSAGMRTTSNSQ